MLKKEGDMFSSVDVVVPCYRYGRFLRECVESVLNQSGVHVRVLIIDDASPDNTAEVAAALAGEHPRVSFIQHIENKGHISTYNEGIEWASADYMLLLSADDYLLPGALERATKLMDAHPEVGFAFGNVLELSDSGSLIQTHSVIQSTANPHSRILEGWELIELTGERGNQVSTCTSVVRTQLQKTVGGYRKELPHAGDMEMWLRFASHGSVGFVFANQGVYRRHSTNMSTAYYCAEDGRLTYRNNGRLGDLQQQKLAIDYFHEYCKHITPKYTKACEGLYRQLSQSIINHASAAFNDGEMEESRRLSDFALAVCPENKNSLGWIRLKSKRWLGARTWRAVRPALAAVRGMRRTQS